MSAPRDFGPEREYRPPLLVRLWLRAVLPAALVVVFLGIAVNALQDDRALGATAYGLVAVLLAAGAFVLDGRTAWAVRVGADSLELCSRWRPASMRLDRLEVVELEGYPLHSMRLVYGDESRRIPRLAEEQEFLRDLFDRAPSAAVRRT